MGLISGYEVANALLSVLEVRGVKVPDRVTRIVVDIKMYDAVQVYYSCLVDAAAVDVLGQVLADKEIDLSVKER